MQAPLLVKLGPPPHPQLVTCSRTYLDLLSVVVVVVIISELGHNSEARGAAINSYGRLNRSKIVVSNAKLELFLISEQLVAVVW